MASLLVHLIDFLTFFFAPHLEAPRVKALTLTEEHFAVSGLQCNGLLPPILPAQVNICFRHCLLPPLPGVFRYRRAPTLNHSKLRHVPVKPDLLTLTVIPNHSSSTILKLTLTSQNITGTITNCFHTLLCAMYPEFSVIYKSLFH